MKSKTRPWAFVLILSFCALQTFIHECSAQRAPAAVTSQAKGQNEITDNRPGRQKNANRRRSENLLTRLRGSEQNNGYLEDRTIYEERHANEQADEATKFDKDRIRSSLTKWRLERQKALLRMRRQATDQPEPSAESTAEPEPTSEPRPEEKPNDGKSEPEPSAESSAEPNPNPESTSEPEPENSWPEPAPEMPSAYEKWQIAWPLHRYGFASIFSLIGVVQVVELIRIYSQRERKTPLKLSLMIMIIIFTSIRAIVLFASPYGLTGSFPLVATRLLSSIGQPCIIAAVSLLLLVLIDTTKMNIAPPRFQRVKFIVPVITIHVLLVVVSDVVVAHFLQVKFLLLFCQLYFLITGLTLTLGYARVGWKISRNVASNVNQVGNRSQDSKMNKLKRLIFAFTVTSGMLIAVTIYGAAGVFGIYSDVTHVEAWPWWGLQTAFRCLETAMCVLLLIMNINTTSSRPSGCFSIFNCTNCGSCCLGRSRVHACPRSTMQNATLQYSSSLAPTTDRGPK